MKIKDRLTAAKMMGAGTEMTREYVHWIGAGDGV
jgi:hypothetical protein